MSVKDDIRHGISVSWTVGLGLVPLGLAFGALVTQTGFAWWWAPVLSIVIFAGSMEFLAIGLIMANTGLVGAGLTAFMVNFRHIFYGLTFPRHLISPKGIKGKMARAYSTYATIDEAYAIAPNERGHTGGSVLTAQIFCQLSWVLSGIVGALAGSAMPDGLQGMEFALTALFVVLGIDAFQSNRDWSLPIVAFICTMIGWAISPQRMLVIGLSLFFLTLVARAWSPRLDKALTWVSEGDRKKMTSISELVSEGEQK